jgi:hypothetical protein
MVRSSSVFVRIAAVMAVSALVICSQANASVIGGFSIASQTNSTYITLSSSALGVNPGSDQFTNPFNVIGAPFTPLAPVVNIGNPPTNSTDQTTALTSDTHYTVTLLSDGVAHNYAFNLTVNNTSGQTIHELGFVFSGPAAFFAGNGINNLGGTITSQTPFISNSHEIVFDANLASGSAQTYGFDFQIPTTASGTLGFQIFAAAPEPTSLILGAIGMVATGGFGFMRRRKPEAAVAA